MSYDGEVMDGCGGLDLDLANSYVVAVSGSGPNFCGHLLFYTSSGGGHYFHVAELHGRPKHMSQSGFARYLQEAGKTEIRRVYVPLPEPQAALNYLDALMRANWTWLLLPNNCVAFCEEIISAGGGTWSSASNCPSVATQPTLEQRATEFLAELERSIWALY